MFENDWLLFLILNFETKLFVFKLKSENYKSLSIEIFYFCITLVVNKIRDYILDVCRIDFKPANYVILFLMDQAWCNTEITKLFHRKSELVRPLNFLQRT